MSHRIRRIALPLMATGGVAAALFGGGAVHTAFTSSASGTLDASTASIGTTLAHGTISLSNALPGDEGDPSSVTITNHGSTYETLSMVIDSGNNPALDNVVDLIWDGTDVGSLASLANQDQLSSTATLAPHGQTGDSITMPLALELESTAGNDVAGQSDSISYTVTGTATAQPPAGSTGGTWSQIGNGSSKTI
jgi:hypothetical protein